MLLQMRAAKSGNHTSAERLLKGGADPDTREVDYVSSILIRVDKVTALVLTASVDSIDVGRLQRPH